MDQEDKTKIENIEARLSKLENSPFIPDHRHTGVDLTRVRFTDLDTIIFKQATINPGNLVDGAGETEQITGFTGANLGDFVLVSAPYDLQDLTVTAYVQAMDVIEIRIQNESGSTVNLDSGMWRIIVIKKVI